jgi:hypothetical protein
MGDGFSFLIRFKTSISAAAAIQTDVQDRHIGLQLHDGLDRIARIHGLPGDFDAVDAGDHRRQFFEHNSGIINEKYFHGFISFTEALFPPPAAGKLVRLPDGSAEGAGFG